MTNSVANHYTQGGLAARIEAGVRAAGKTPETVSVEDLGPVDEFHMGGRPATEALLSQLDLGVGSCALDVGCGLGGTARFAHEGFRCRVSGIDLTEEFVETARTLSEWVGFGKALSFFCGSALDMPFEEGAFDAAFQLHVGMNIRDKTSLFAEVARVLRSGGLFGVYDVMRTGDAALNFPVPWATEAKDSAVATPEEYEEALRENGFEIVSRRDRGEMAREFFQRMRARAENGAPPLGLHLVMGKDAPTKVANANSSLEAGGISPVEIVARRR